MENTLLGVGIGCIIAAIVGGGLKAFGMEIPLVNSAKRQALLALFGLILIASSGLPRNSPQPTQSDVALPNLAYGTWTLHNAIDDDGKNWSESTLKFTSQQKTSDGLLLQGTFTWRLNDTLMGTEQFTGYYLNRNRQIILEGESVSNAPKSGVYSLTTGSYSAVVSPDERELLDGRWGSTMNNEPGVAGKWNASR